MNKSKFKAVRFKPFDLELYWYDKLKSPCWTNMVVFGRDMKNDVYFTDSCIDEYPELFEAEKVEREFEELAYYKARYRNQSTPEAIKYIFGKFFRSADVLGSQRSFDASDFFEIGEKIEL